jgi:glutathione S-transferase
VLDDVAPLESGAIIWYLGDGRASCARTRIDGLQVLQCCLRAVRVEPTLAVVRFLVAYSGNADQYAEVIEQKTKAGYKALAAMEGHISGREWFVGDAMTLADIALYAYTHVAPEGGIQLESYPAVRAWLARVAAEPGHIAIDA